MSSILACFFYNNTDVFTAICGLFYVNFQVIITLIFRPEPQFIPDTFQVAPFRKTEYNTTTFLFGNITIFSMRFFQVDV